jgi:hypothetical protein
MLNLNNVSIIAVACVRVENTLKAMKYSMKDINFASAKLLTSLDISDDEIEIIKINHLDYNSFNHFVVFELWKYVDTEFALRIEDDGFVINKNAWTDDFLKYDYIGAPWPLPNDDFSYRDHFGNLIRVGNGGFSLRSKKLLKLPSEFNLEWKPYFGNYHEDGFITCHNRHFFEEEGCKFAPLEVAIYFSKEHEIPENQGVVSFGFHGKFSEYNILLNESNDDSKLIKIKLRVKSLIKKIF